VNRYEDIYQFWDRIKEANIPTGYYKTSSNVLKIRIHNFLFGNVMWYNVEATGQTQRRDHTLGKLVLFDIDGTLIRNTQAHKIAFSSGFKQVYGISASIDSINHHGLTDQQIIKEVLSKHGLKEKVIEEKIKECMEAMVNSFRGAIKTEEIYLLPGVKPLLETLHKMGLLLGLVTGNLQEIAEGKLRKASIYHYFKVGGFGSDAPQRATMLKIAIDRASKIIGKIQPQDVFLFGDTIYDVMAGKQVGVNTIAVATGSYSEEMLKDADIVVSSLEDTQSIVNIITRT